MHAGTVCQAGSSCLPHSLLGLQQWPCVGPDGRAFASRGHASYCCLYCGILRVSTVVVRSCTYRFPPPGSPCCGGVAVHKLISTTTPIITLIDRKSYSSTTHHHTLRLQAVQTHYPHHAMQHHSHAPSPVSSSPQLSTMLSVGTLRRFVPVTPVPSSRIHEMDGHPRNGGRGMLCGQPVPPDPRGVCGVFGPGCRGVRVSGASRGGDVCEGPKTAEGSPLLPPSLLLLWVPGGRCSGWCCMMQLSPRNP